MIVCHDKDGKTLAQRWEVPCPGSPISKPYSQSLYTIASYYSRRRVLHQEDIKRQHSTVITRRLLESGCLGLNHGPALLSCVCFEQVT